MNIKRCSLYIYTWMRMLFGHKTAASHAAIAEWRQLLNRVADMIREREIVRPHDLPITRDLADSLNDISNFLGTLDSGE